MSPSFCSITLAGGRGSRMPADMPPKSCCRIGPVSVIENALTGYEQAGIRNHVVVVGHEAPTVMAEVCRIRRDVLFAYQVEPRGTGDAVRCALELLASSLSPDHVLISAGDKVVDPGVIAGIVETYVSSDYDLCLLAGDVKDNPGGGRIIVRGKSACAITEMADINARHLTDILRQKATRDRHRTVAELRCHVGAFLSPAKLAAWSPGLAAVLKNPDDDPVPWPDVLRAIEGLPTDFQIDSGSISLEEAEASTLSNLSLYVGRFDLVREAVRDLSSDNVTGECYFTDIVSHLASRGKRVGVLKVRDGQDVMAFNTIEQLEEVRKIHAVRIQGGARYPKLEQWERHFGVQAASGQPARAVSGLREKIGAERTGVVVRSPGRINIMGRHIDHQGGTCNLLAINREVVLAASAREDDRINLWNVNDADYPSRSFTFGELTSDIVWGDWLRTLELQYVKRVPSMKVGDWANYVMGAALRLQHWFKDRKLKGMDAFVCGNIPVGSGLSSSSALVVAATEALVELNALNVRPRELVDLCGEGEWFVGTRGGSADHAAITLGREKEVVSVSFFPFEIVGHHPFPDACSLMVCHSGLSAKKTEGAKGKFNVRIACYHLAREIIKRECGGLAKSIEHLRDVNAERLDITAGALYRVLRGVPVAMTPGEVRALAEEHAEIATCLGSLAIEEQDFPLRDVALFGLAEMERSKRAGRLLDDGDAKGFGRMMTISHDGDRVGRWDAGVGRGSGTLGKKCQTPQKEPAPGGATDAAVDELIARCEGLTPLSESGAALWQQPGGYACSTPEIDLMVDTALAQEGVLGAQLSGAGLGGCVMILLESAHADAVRKALEETYYEPRGIEPQLFVCQPSRGSQVLTSVETTR